VPVLSWSFIGGREPLSAPVLSRLFFVTEWRRLRTRCCHHARKYPWTRSPSAREGSAGIRTLAGSVSSSPLLGRGFGAQDPITQPLEPILFPKLRIYFADFPYLHCSTWLEAFHLGDLMRLWVRPGVRISPSLGFSRGVRKAPDTSRREVLSQPWNPLSRQSDSRVRDC